ncbi:nicolin-1-like isoform X1 [Oscarella lobularis]|uniref:nicolin-1-like isoform X1 n=1 Tax=Oscarella lobularis TaxID=121494 RepID=UPI0033131AD0
MERFVVRPSYAISLGDSGSGCAAIDVSVRGEPVEIDSISFRNFYTASVTVKVRTMEEKSRDEVPYKTLVKNFILMPQPHCEQGGQNFYRITPSQMLFCPKNVLEVRLIMHQPSHCWANFGLNEIEFNTPSQEPEKAQAGASSSSLTREEIQTQLSEMSSMLDQIRISDQLVIGRFDVNGTYDLNLLSYT